MVLFMSDKLVWHTETRKIEDLIPTENNPRQLTKKQAKDLEKSLSKFNLVDIPAINLDNRIISGHQRISILKSKNGHGTEIDVRVPSRKLTEEEHREYLIRANKNTGEWNYDLLANFDSDLLKESGFSTAEMERILDTEITEDNFDAKREYDKIKEARTKTGDIWQLGDHRLMCGDSTNLNDIKKLMNGKKASLIYNDPPYNVNYDYTSGYKNGIKTESYVSKFNDKKKPQEFQNFIQKVFENLYQVTEDFAPFYCWHASINQNLFKSGIENAKYKISQTIYWLKNIPTFNIGLDYLYITEPCFFGWKAGNKHYVNKKLVLSMKNIEILNKLDFKSLIDVIYSKRDSIKDYIHPTQKPLALCERALKKHSQQESIVVDAFAGSGSTLMACHQLGRVCYTIELDPKFCDAILKRWENSTNIKPKLI
ncbi:MAG: DNA modification methylase [Nanoarchaeota archaeon]